MLYRGMFINEQGKELVISLGFDAKAVRARVRKHVFAVNTSDLVGGWVERKTSKGWQLVDGADPCFT
jgi:hypothetical protein